MSNLDIWERTRSVPETAMKTIAGGRLAGMTDINPVWRMKTLTEVFGPCGTGWYYEITNKCLQNGCKDEIAAFVDINLYVRTAEGWSKPIPGTGGSLFVSNETRGGLRTSDEAFKMATTDALSVACKALGIGADVYFAKDTTKYTSPNGQPAYTQPPQANTSPRQQATPPAPRQEPPAPPDRKKELIREISMEIRPQGNAGPTNGWAYEIYQKLMSNYHGLDERIKSLNDLDIARLIDMKQKICDARPA